uniref:Calcyphosine 2 n=1 Tax=Leptobrachium leishanense TaxID=445787 RepID=A0A8C5MCZ4_9ANUR
MNLEIKGVGATPRGKNRQTSSNTPAKGWRQPSRSSDKRPDEVPYLDLGKLGDSDDEDTYKPLADEYPRFGPPDSSSTISWGTPIQTPYAQHFQDPKVMQKPKPVRTELSLDFKKTVPENLPPPSDRFKLKYQQYEEEMKQNYKHYTKRSANRNLPDTHRTPRHQMRNQENEDAGFAVRAPLDAKAQLQQCYTSKPYTAQHSLRMLEAEDLAAERRKQAVVEQVMIDHLSRAVISDPEQSSSTAVLDNPERDLSSAPLRFRKRTLHETKIKTTSTFTETMLSNKLRFDARIMCRNGRDACRELIGFFFSHDKSITIYEYRQFGKNRTNALPFIQKGVYSHQCGTRSGKPYELRDFYVGSNLTFLTKEHHSLADSLKQNPMVTTRITSIDEDAMNSLRVICGESKVDFGVKANDDSGIFSAIQDMMKEKLKSRGVRTLTGLGKYFRQLDKTESGLLSKSEFKQALKTFHLDVSENVFESFWLLLNENNEEKMDYMLFINALIGEMNEHRKSFVIKAFMKLDPNKSGMVSMVDLRKFYCAKKHPRVLEGISTEDEIKSAFLETMTDACKDPKDVSYGEFEDYYEGLSIGILRDEDFVNILRNSWGI